jgi:hypothetical protein
MVPNNNKIAVNLNDNNIAVLLTHPHHTTPLQAMEGKK